MARPPLDPRELKDGPPIEDEDGDGVGQGTVGGAGGKTFSAFSKRVQNAVRDSEHEFDAGEARDKQPKFVYPSLDTLEHDVLENGYKIAFYRGIWLLYDENNRGVGRFRDPASAEKRAFILRPAQSSFSP